MNNLLSGFYMEEEETNACPLKHQHSILLNILIEPKPTFLALFRKNDELVRELSCPAEGAKKLLFSTRFAQNEWEQFKACLWKQHLSYWRNPQYNLGRLTITAASSLLFGALLWQKGQTM